VPRKLSKPATPFGRELRGIREARGLTQRAFAELVKSEQSTVGKWERGIALPQPDNWEGLLKALNQVEREALGKALITISSIDGTVHDASVGEKALLSTGKGDVDPYNPLLDGLDTRQAPIWMTRGIAHLESKNKNQLSDIAQEALLYAMQCQLVLRRKLQEEQEPGQA
jgi:transcriptional regulator with XRE-family HTH domain